MTFPKLMRRLAPLAVLALLAASASEGATVALVDASYTISSGATVETSTLKLSGPGTVGLTLTNIPWPAPLTGMLFELFDASGHAVGTSNGFGTSTFTIDSAGTYFAVSVGSVAPLAGALIGFGSFGIDLSFTPTSVPAVPLPPAIALLASGLAAIGTRRLRRRTAINM
jgi:hypothetical protein